VRKTVYNYIVMRKIYQYSCELNVRAPHPALRQSNEIHMESMLERRIPGYGYVDCLPMWFYFYITPIRDPLTLTQHSDGDVEIHPGTNRFIGRSIRGDEPWAPARIICIDNPWMHRLEGIRNEELIGCREFEYNQKTDFYSNKDLYNWTHGGYAPTGNDWLEMPERWAGEQLGEWGGVLILHNGNKHFINKQAPQKIKINVSKHTGLTVACRKLFRKLESKMENKDA